MLPLSRRPEAEHPIRGDETPQLPPEAGLVPGLERGLAHDSVAYWKSPRWKETQ